MAISALLDDSSSTAVEAPNGDHSYLSAESSEDRMSLKALTSTEDSSASVPVTATSPANNKFLTKKLKATLHTLEPNENEDFSFNVLSPVDMETAFQLSSYDKYSTEKAEYLDILNTRIRQISTLDTQRHELKRNAFHEKHMLAAQAKSEVLRRYASKELYSRAMRSVLKVEEQSEKDEKRLHKLAQQRERRAQRAAAARAEKEEDITEEEGGEVDDSGRLKRSRIPSAKAKINDANSRLRSKPKPGESATKAKLVSLAPAESDSVTKEDDTKPIVKPQKEVRAVARLYYNTYDSIWKEMARRDASRLHRIIHSSANIRLSNAKKTSVLAAKEARRWQFKTNKTVKDLQMKARRSMREMLLFWKRNEREERELQKKAEKEAQDQAKKEEEERETRRQARKLNFLISQTELYTHFIGRKMDTTQVKEPERNIEELDFDAAGDDELHQAAMGNARKAFEDTQARARNFNNDGSSAELKKADIDAEEMNFQNPTSLGDIQIPQPKMLSCQLKEYQIKGLSWLANLYEQGINGILADEMGLGKTVQSISVMSYLAEKHGIWGPFLVVTPASTLHNWQQEIAKFVPSFKVLPYWGNGKDRKVLRKFWDHKNVKYNKDSQFHVLVTSYQLVVADASYFQKIKWQYMILDEAQAIKSSSSSRWKSLLSFQCRNRLLLTGTPIQNSMQELWALLHFIMPSLFDSHDEFSEWFSKDIESHAQSNTQLNEQQLTRLHMILKPFMLRRLKKHVQSELGEKIEEDVYCELTSRQRLLYKTLRSQISLMDLIEKAASGSDEGTQSLMNLVMQFRKVCNHPDLFERADVRSAYNFSTSAITVGTIRDGPEIDLFYTARNQISLTVPKLLYRSGGFLDVPSESSPAGFTSLYLNNLLSIWSPDYVVASDAFSWMRLIDTSPSEISKMGKTGCFERAVSRYSSHKSSSVFANLYDEEDGNYVPHSNTLLINEQQSLLSKSSATSTGVLESLLNIGSNMLDSEMHNYLEPAFGEPVLCPPIFLRGSDRSIGVDQENFLFNPETKSVLYPMTLNKEWDLFSQGVSLKDFPATNLFPWARNTRMGFNTIRMPSMSKFVTDSGKLAKLDEMLPVLKANDHRVLIYFQMTKMMDLMEEYLTFRQYKYCRLDGSSKLTERRDLVNDWQTKPELFVFLLSTRAGGLGINLTAADTVIFYDSDWNPTIDSQAMDRAHRMGQTRQVTVYRMLVKGTIEERMRDRAKQKMHVQQVVMEGGGGSAGTVDFQKPGREVAYWLLDDDDAADAMIKKKQEEVAINGKGRGIKRGANAVAPNNDGVKKKVKTADSLIEDMYHEGEGNFEESSQGPTPLASGATTPVPSKGGRNRKRMTTEQRLKAVGSGDF